MNIQIWIFISVLGGSPFFDILPLVRDMPLRGKKKSAVQVYYLTVFVGRIPVHEVLQYLALLLSYSGVCLAFRLSDEGFIVAQGQALPRTK